MKRGALGQSPALGRTAAWVLAAGMVLLVGCATTVEIPTRYLATREALTPRQERNAIEKVRMAAVAWGYRETAPDFVPPGATGIARFERRSLFPMIGTTVHVIGVGRGAKGELLIRCRRIPPDGGLSDDFRRSAELKQCLEQADRSLRLENVDGKLRIQVDLIPLAP